MEGNLHVGVTLCLVKFTVTPTETIVSWDPEICLQWTARRQARVKRPPTVPGRLHYGLIYYKPLAEEECLISTHNTFEDCIVSAYTYVNV